MGCFGGGMPPPKYPIFSPQWCGIAQMQLPYTQLKGEERENQLDRKRDWLPL